MGSTNKNKKWGKAALAAMVAAATLCTPVAGAFAADGGGGSGTGSGTGDGAAGGEGQISWVYKDSFGAPTRENVKAAMQAAGVKSMDGAESNGAIDEAVTNANNECVARAKASGNQNPECRLVSVGFVHTPGKSGDWYTGANGGFNAKKWADAYKAAGISGTTYYYQGVGYKTTDNFSDGQTNIDSLSAREMAKAPRSVVAIVLDQDEPPVDTPPAPPTKHITEGVSADSMTNTTTIESKTGRKGTKLDFKDTFDPHGQKYTVSNLKVTDKTANKDMTGSYTFNTANGATPADNVLTATWNGGNLPDDHDFEFTFDVTVSTPETSKVEDKGHVFWQGVTKKQDQDTDNHEFPTWKPNPDKTWVKWTGKGWKLVTDPTRSNKTGADDNYFLDGDKVASAVNATVEKNLVKDQLKTFSIEDDYAAADYLFDADGKSSIRVYEADADTAAQSSVDGIDAKGKDVTSLYDITVEGTKVTATAKASHLKELTGMASPKQVTLLVPGVINMANGEGAAQARKDMGVGEGDETSFCTAGKDGHELTNSGAEVVNNQSVSTNEPKICGYVPPVKKDVIGEASQGGDQDSVDGKVVFPGQKVEYQLTTQPKLPENLAYDVTDVAVTDTFDQYLEPDKQTLEVRDLTTGKTISKKRYKTTWDDADHAFRLSFDDEYVKANWGKGRNPSVLVRFEGTVSETAPTDHKVGNQWGLTLNNSLTPSNKVYNEPPKLTPRKDDVSSKDRTVSIDGKTLLLGDTGNYILTLDAKDLSKDSTAYKVQRLGLVDDYDEEYLDIDQTRIEVLDSNGKDVTSKFNVQIKDGVAYVFAKTVDTEIPATGETVKGDPQPADLKEYSTRKLDATKDPSIDQDLLGQEYQVVLPYKVAKVQDGKVVKNKAIQITNDLSRETNEVSNPLKPINPAKDVTVKVGGESIDGKSVYLGRTFLYQLDSSIIPANRAYPQVDQWKIVDPLNTEYDQYTGQWAVYATRDLYAGGQVVAAKGDRIAGNGFDSSKFGGDLFTATADGNGQVTVEATDLYRQLVSTDIDHEAGWRAYIQCKRVKVGEKIENQFTEIFNDKNLPSNIVWTRTPDMTPSIHIEKYDVASGEQAGDRDDVKDALKMAGDSQEIAFKITNTSKVDSSTGEGAWYLAKDLKMVDKTIAGEGEVVDLKYPDNWDTLVLKPGESTIITGTLKGVQAGGKHTNRVKVTGTPLVECPVTDQLGDQQPADGDQTGDSQSDGDGQSDTGTGTKTDGDADDTTGLKQVKVGDTTLCEDTTVESNTDDWNGYRESLAKTGATIAGILLAIVAFGAIGVALMGARRRTGAHSGR